MPNWKKLIVSGSDATLNSLDVSTAVTADIITANTINATTFNSQVVSSSVVFTSGSNIIGDELTDNHQITGSVFITGSLSTQGIVSASTFQGDGSQLTGIESSVVETATVLQSFTNQLSVAVTHNFESKNVITTVYQGDEQIIPKSITTTSDNVVTVTFDIPTTGRVVIAKGGHLVSGVSTNGITRTIETYTSSQGQTVFSTAESIVGDNIDVYINGFKLLRSDFIITDSNTVTLTSGSSAGEQVEINLYNPFFGTYLVQQDLDGYVTGSVTGSNIVGSNTISSIETITSAAYAAITPQTDILYIITD